MISNGQKKDRAAPLPRGLAMPPTQAPNHQGGSRHQGPLSAALNTRGGSNIPPRGLNCGCFAVFSTQHHTEVQAAHPRHSSSFPPLQAEEQLPSLETWPGLISCVLFRACSLAPTVFSGAYHTLRACARSKMGTVAPRHGCACGPFGTVRTPSSQQ